MKFRVHFHKSIPRGGEHPVRATHGIRDGRRKDELPPDPGDARMEKYGFYMVPSAGSNIPVEFTADESGKVDLYLEEPIPKDRRLSEADGLKQPL